MRLRTTAPPSAFLMLKPKRLSGSRFARKKTVKWEFERRLPVRYTASNSPRRTIRAVRGNSRPSGLLGREPMASLLAARRQHLAASDGLHAYAKSVCLRSPPFVRLICSLWQSNPPCFLRLFTTIVPFECFRGLEATLPYSSGVGALVDPEPRRAPTFRARKIWALVPEEAVLVETSPSTRRVVSIFHLLPRTTPPAQADSRRQAASAAYSESISVVDPRARGQENCGVAYRAGKVIHLFADPNSTW